MYDVSVDDSVYLYFPIKSHNVRALYHEFARRLTLASVWLYSIVFLIN